MIDTMGPGLPAVQTQLTNRYSSTNFTLLNYGVGATNLEYGIERITNGYNYLGNQIPSLASTRPDIVVLESFAYNPFPDADGGVTRHWLALSHAVDALKHTIPGVTTPLQTWFVHEAVRLLRPTHRQRKAGVR